MNTEQERAEQLKAMGYRRVSNRHGIAARVDREDWREYMAQQHSPWNLEQGMKWVKGLRNSAADFYRRVYSKDVLELPQSIARLVPTSGHDPIGYVKKG